MKCAFVFKSVVDENARLDVAKRGPGHGVSQSDRGTPPGVCEMQGLSRTPFVCNGEIQPPFQGWGDLEAGAFVPPGLVSKEAAPAYER